MSWEDTVKAMAESRYFRLSEDGNTADITFVGEPRPITKNGKGGAPVRRYYISVYHDGEVKTWDCSKDTIGRVASLPDRGYGRRFTVERHGKPDDPKTYYTFVEKPLSPQEANWLKMSGLLETTGAAPDKEKPDGSYYLPF
jgi:hypothetical protein